ncbi:UvrD-helicase domain-containing protein [Bradyrhizobium sp. CIR3A]|uniref:UvrD-helicase domain-containing protein n=1 Tax=Bradyrhizobium sp. CIR3A TaxID=2663838 RepID=UPI001606138F|nr:UvrD-helicase domain-containing protein [Bradyrhizobium sp. CIR3A]MBB4263571.1 superfamily I DNA/RNA helicase [Bradyrhizobium sp. CIR3A]
MDNLEITRRTAESLHLAAVQRGADPQCPYEFVQNEALRRSIEVEKLPKGDARLRGARASYDPGALTILHEDTGDAFLDAFLVAHELGHVEFGGAHEAASSFEADPTRAAEAAPIGVDRVIDYGRRERREVQMDLFGREFLLPRSVVRALHVQEQLTASSIAGRFGAPFAVVAQQLLDATLLPPVASSKENRTEKPLNEEQQVAAEDWGSPYLLEAGPGTGKTQTLVGRVEWLLEHKKIPPDQILVLTFSNKAAGELSDRLAARRPEAAAAMWIGTFHSFGLDVIRRFHERLKLPANPRLMDRTEAIDLLADRFPQLDLQHYRDVWDPSMALSDILAAISRAKDEVASPQRYAELSDAMYAAAATAEAKEAAGKCQEVAKVYAAYEALKEERHCLDFGDLVAIPVCLIEGDEEVRTQLQARHRYVLVDEFQDVNRASVRLLKALCGAGENLWVVGDAKQSIYRFRGASSVNIARFANKDFPGGKSGRLKVNYRSSEEIVNAFVAFAGRDMKAAAGADVTLEAKRGPSGSKPEYRAVDVAPNEIVAMAEAIEAHRAAGISYRDQALLCTGNDRLGRIAAGLESLGIPLLYLGSLFERDEIQQLLSFLSLLIDRRSMGLVRVGTMPEFPLKLADAAAVIAHLKDSDAAALTWLNGPPLGGVSAEAATTFAQLRSALDGFSSSSNPWDVLARLLLDRTRLAAGIARSDAVADRTRGVAIWQFMNFVRAQPAAAGLPSARLLDRIRRLVLLADERDLRELPAAAQSIDAVRLMTIHGSKGLEFRAVHLPGMNADTIPRSPNHVRGCIPPDGLIEGVEGTGLEILKAGHVEEQECLFFVALSRARDCLTLYSPTRTANDRPRSRSGFLDRLGDTLASVNLTTARALPASADDAPIAMSFPSGIVLSDHQLALFHRCPRRFFYTHILEIGGRRRETSFMQMHGTVREVIDWLTLDPATTPAQSEIEARLAEAWDAQKLGDHGYSEDYRRIAKQLIGFFLSSRDGYARSEPSVMRFRVGNSEIVVRPDDVLTAQDGRRHVRAVRTGHAGAKDLENVAAAVFALAAHKTFPGCIVEFVHLGDATVRSVSMTTRVLGNRQSTAEEMIGEIQAGRFPREDSPRTCPRCPAFFICGPVPAGTLEKKFAS